MSKQAEAKRDGVINPHNYNFNEMAESKLLISRKLMLAEAVSKSKPLTNEQDCYMTVFVENNPVFEMNKQSLL